MQQQRVLILVLAFSAAHLAPAAVLSAANQARLFLRSHAESPVGPDELAELKGANPEAYALVKALLTKRSLGLLDPRHPTASFEAPTAEKLQQQQQAEQGPEVFSSMLRPGELEASQVHRDAPAAQAPLPYAAVQPAAHRDWMNWKPQESGASDDQMVENVLGAVAELKGKKPGLLRRAPDEASSVVEAAPEAAQPPPVKPAAAAAPAESHENSYLKGIDFGISAPETPAKPEKPKDLKENSYLKGIDLSGDMPAAPSSKRTSSIQDLSANYLASFSWDDSKPKEHPQHPKVVAQPQANPSKDNTLLSWLGVVHKAPAPKAVAAEPAKPSNPYLFDLD